MILKCFLLAIALLVPLFAGFAVQNRKAAGAITLFSVAESYLYGFFALCAVFQLLAVPFVYFRFSFASLYVSFFVFGVVLTILGILRIKKGALNLKPRFPKAPVMWVVFTLTIGVIGLQLYMYLFGMHLDEDDARWLAEASDALAHDMMFLHNPATGEYAGRAIGEVTKDIFSPWPMFIATLSRFTGIDTATMAHTILAPGLLLLSYTAFFGTGRQLFKQNNERLIFLFMVSVVVLFFYGGSDSEAAFSLIRIWQGKAIVAGVVIPAVFMQVQKIQQERENMIHNWLLLAMISCASCLFSGMGIVITIIMTSGYGFYVILTKRSWKMIPLWLFAFLPAVAFRLMSQYLS